MTPADPQHRAGLTAGALGVWWVLCTALYVAFVSFVWTQVVAGALVAALAVGLSQLALRSAGLRLGGAAPHVWRLGAVAAILGGELRAVTVALVAQLTGRRRVQGRFAAAGLHHRIDAAEDAAITFEASLAPNTYVVGVVQHDDDAVLLVHQLAAQDEVRRSFPRWRR